MTELKVLSISNDEEVSRYKSYLQKLNPYNPYARYELIIPNSQEKQILKYFLLTHTGEPIVLMPFYLKPVVLNEEVTSYYDAVSPWGYMGPLLTKDDFEILPIFWKNVDDWYRDHNVITEFIRFNFTDNHLSYSGRAMHTLSNIRGRILEEDLVWGAFKRSVRKNYRKAIEHQLQCSIFHQAISTEKIIEFYEIWKGTMKRHDAGSSYYHSFEYFKNFIHKNEDHCALATVYNDEGKAISTELLLLSNDTMYSFLGGTDAKFFQLRPNDLLKIEAINWARKRGFDYYILGGGLSDGDSLYEYKKKFFPGDPEISFYTGRKILNKHIYNELNIKAGTNDHISTIEEDIEGRFFPKYRFPALKS